MSRAIESLFSIRIGIDQNLNITEISRTLTKYMPQACVGESLLDYFSFHRPSNIKKYSDIFQQQGSLVLLIGNEDDFAVRGQFVDLETLKDSSTALTFLGSPWVGWLSANRQDIQLKLSDFGAQDAQLDQIFLTATQQQNVKDLQELAEKLRVEKERSEEASNIRSDFFAVMNHEMRTPLNGVVTALNLIDKSRIDRDEKRLFNMAMASAENLLVVVNNVLDFSKLEANKFVLEETSFNMKELLLSVKSVLATKAQQSGIDLNITIPDDLPPRLQGDDSKIRQVLINLVANAIKFTDKGSVTLGVKLLDEGPEKDYRFWVEDTGTGVNPEIEAKIFEPFWTKVNGRSEIGTGLGLYICRRLIQMMGSDIDFTSEFGEGSTFWFDLRLESSRHFVDSDDSERSKSEEADDKPVIFEGRVLLVEDNPTNQALAKILIERLGPAVEVASDGVEAIAMTKNYPYDLIFMDINMPTMGGIEATEVIRKDDQFKELPIVALTAYSGAIQKEKYLSMGMNGYLKKPIETARLKKELSKWLRNGRKTVIAVEKPYSPPTQKTVSPNATPSEKTDISSHIDSEVFRRVYTDIGENNFDKIFEGFLKDLSDASARMTELCIDENRERLGQTAHSLSSSVRTFGALGFGDALAELEESTKHQSFAFLDPEVDRLQVIFTEVISALKAEREAL